MATGCYGGARRLSDLLQEQQEPFIQVQPPQRRRSPVVAARKALLCKAARKALLLQWDLDGCFRCGARQSFRRLPRAGDIAGRCDVAISSELAGGGDGAVDGGRQRSPVSVLELQSDDDSPQLSIWDDDDKPSSSPPSDRLPGGAIPCSTFFVTTNGKIRAMEAQVEGITNSKRLRRRKMERATVSGWESIAADISRIPTLVALDLSAGSAREWRWSVAAGEEEEEEEARRVGQSIEAIIFEELRWEAVRDIICLRHF
ncbi:unnamed protein product [Urochloa decumbens]|uniref:Uncharacterized protein n=1 Tax=Urochloa decumbens TaxID=240449 RepID=A0ABC8VVH5_9POAL